MFLKGKKKRYAIGIVGISILIANLHVAVWPFLFVLFLPYIAEYIIASLADVIIYRKIGKKILELKIKNLKSKNINAEKINILEEKLLKLNEQIDRIKIKRDKELENPYKIKLVKNKKCQMANIDNDNMLIYRTNNTIRRYTIYIFSKNDAR